MMHITYFIYDVQQIIAHHLRDSVPSFFAKDPIMLFAMIHFLVSKIHLDWNTSYQYLAYNGKSFALHRQ